MKNKIFIIILCLAITILSSCANANMANIADTSNEIGNGDIADETISPIIDPKYANIHFGETEDILLLDVEWHTVESYQQERDEILSEYRSFPGWYDEFGEESHYEFIIRLMEAGKYYISKKVNGKSTKELNFHIRSSNPYNNFEQDDEEIFSMNPDGYFIYNIYPFYWDVYYIGENNERHEKNFFEGVGNFLYTPREFNFIADEVKTYCDELLTQNKITKKQYDLFIIKSPLDYFVRVIGLFGNESGKDISAVNILPLPPPEFITGKKDFSILFVGNSLTIGVPEKVSMLSGMYEITVDTGGSITDGGASLSDTMNKAIKKMRDKQYDYVIFQDIGGFVDYKLLDMLCEEARKSGAIPVLYNPAWLNIDGKPDKEKQFYQTATHEKAAKVNGAILVNAAEAWIYAYNKHPDISLYNKNDYHPNKMGQYLTACVFASALFNLHIKDVPEGSSYNIDEAIILGQAAWEYVSYYNENRKSPTEIITVPDGSNENVR